ncbi:MAG TPA: hypothetical protein VGB15_03975 [Longimicrobium sp.]|jgi:hypothetical protein
MPSAWWRVALVAILAAACGSPAADRDAPSLAGEPWTIRSGDPSAPAPVIGAVPAAVREFCHAPHPTPPGPEGGRRVAAVPVATLSESGVETPLRCVVRSREQWQSFRALATPGALPDGAAGFPREALLVAAMGVRGNTGYEIALGPVTSRGDTVVVTVVSTSSGPSIQHDVVLTPLSLARIPASAGPVLWIEKAQQR